jgi:dipeptidyl aminopeptidase/acylaminoacyl peptidase
MLGRHRGGHVVALTRPAEPASTTNILMTLGLAAAVGLAGLVWMGVRAATVTSTPPPATGPAHNGLLLYESHGSLFVRSSTGQSPRQLLAGTDPYQRLDPIWSPDGQRFALLVRNEDGYGLATMAADGTGIAALPATDPTQVAWSPDSSTLAVIEGAPLSSLDVISAFGTYANLLQFSGQPVLHVSWQPPHGQLLVAEVESWSGERDLYLTDPFGDSIRPLGLSAILPRQSDETSGAVFSPDGRTIAFAAVAGGLSSSRPIVRVSLVDVDGSGVRELPGSPTEATSETPVAYSPDGRWLLIRRSAPGGCCPSFRPEAWLAIIPADGSGPARDIGPRLPEIDTTVNAAFSPDGTRILTGAQTDTPTVYSVDPITGNFQTLDWTETVPTWQRVGP